METLLCTLYYGAFLFFIAGALGAVLFRKNDGVANIWSNAFAAVGSLSGVAVSLQILLGGDVFSSSFSTSFPLFSYSLTLDRLGAFFVFVVCLIGIFSSIYGFGYARHYYGKQNIGRLGFFYNIFIGSIILVVSASNAVFFLIAWEIMSLSSYFLVIYEQDKTENISAGSLYFIMTHAGTAFIILLFLITYQFTGSFDFAQIRAASANIPRQALVALFLFALVGFGTKAGVVPLHIWLPAAHPAAPSHVSALMSGVMIKTGIYMLFRVCFDLLPFHALWMGMIVLLLGSVSALLGVLYALAEHDLKKLLAYHSIENIGIILLGIGCALVFSAMGLSSLAILGFAAALFHTMNHAVFKALLFLSAGAVIERTHTRNMEQYGGIIKFMPWTALFFLVGSMAISALPPFNGFFSEWMTFQALFSGIQSFDLITKGVFIFATGLLALTGGLAAACFVKAFGITFLARPRDAGIRLVTESDLPLRVSMACLALLTLIFGIFSGSVSVVLAHVAGSLPLFETAGIPLAETPFSIRFANGAADVSGVAVAAMIIVVLAIVLFVVRVLTTGSKTKVAPTWDCGTKLGPRMEITATGFSRSLTVIFQGLLKPSMQTEIEYSDARMRYFPKFGAVTLSRKHMFSEYFYKPLHGVVLYLSEKMKKIQGGNVNWYVLYIFLALVVLLLIVSVQV